MSAQLMGVWKQLINRTADTLRDHRKIAEPLNTKEGILAEAQYVHTQNNLHYYNSATEKHLNH